MIEMSQTEGGDINETGLFIADDKYLAATDVSRKCNTALEILQNEVINCEKNISLEKSQRELDEKKMERDEQLKKVSSPLVPVYISSNECADRIENSYSTIFNNDQFSDLIGNIMRVGNHFNGIEEDDVQKIIFEFAELNKINHGFDKTLRKTENAWYQRFIQSYPNLSSVIKKSFNDSVQLHKTDMEFSSRIVDKFVSDYKNSKLNAAKSEQSAEYENLRKEKYINDSSNTEQVLESSKSYQKDEEISSKYGDFEAINRNEFNNFSREENNLTSKIVGTDSTTSHADSDQSGFNTSKEKLSSGCLADSPKCIGSKQECDAVSSLCSINSHFEDDCSTKRNFSANDENISNEQYSDSFGNFKANKCDSGKIVGVNLTNQKADLSQIATSERIPSGKSFEPTEASEICNMNVINCVKSSNTTFSENPNNASNLENTDIKLKTTENLEVLESVNNNLPSDDDSDFDKCVSSSPKPLNTETVTGEKSDNEIHLKTTSDVPFTSGMLTSQRMDIDCSAKLLDEGNEKKEKIFKRKRSLNKKPAKKSKKYVYKLKSYNTVSVFQFTSSTPYSFMKPVIKLTKLDEDSFKNIDSSIVPSPSTNAEQEEANYVDRLETNCDTGNSRRDEVEAKLNICINNELTNEAEIKTGQNAGNDSKSEVVRESNSNANNDSNDEVETEASSIASNDSNGAVETEESYNVYNDSTNEDAAEISHNVSKVSKDELEMETNDNSNNELKNEDEEDTNTVQDNSKDGVEAKRNIDPGNDLKDESEVKINSDAGNDLKDEVSKSWKTNTEKNLNRISKKESDSPTLKMKSTNENVTPTFGMQTRRKRLKFLPDGTLVTPNQRHPHYMEDLSTPSRSESKSAKKRSLKTPPQDTSKPEKKIKISSTPTTLKQANRSTGSTKKVCKSRQDRYIPEANGKSKKPQKIFDYDSYYRENFRETEVKLPPSCKKQMVALSRVTSISPAAQSGGQFTVNPAQLLSCLLGMPITPDQIRTIRFKPPVKQIKPNKQMNNTHSKLASNDVMKPVTKRHLEMLQNKPPNILQKTEITVTKSKPVA